MSSSVSSRSEDLVPMPLTWLPVHERAFRDKVRDFGRSRVAPLAAEMDQAEEFDQELIADLFAEGLMGIEISEAYGGLGGGLFHVVLAIEELARVDPAVAVLVDVQNALVISALLRCGSGDQKRRYLPKLASGTIGAYAISEREAGSDAFAMSTRAEADGSSYRLIGKKAWITNAAEAGLFLVYARTGDSSGTPELTAFLVERDSAGLSVGERVPKMGIKASSTCPITLDGVRVNRENVLGSPGQGAVIAVETLNIGKLGIAAQLVGLAAGALHIAVDHAARRRQFGRPIADFQGVRFPLARIAADLEATRLLLYNTTRLVQHGSSPTERLRATAMAKLVASDVAERAASCALETLGGAGFTTESSIEKLYRDAKIGKIYEGTSNIQLRTIAATLLPELSNAAPRDNNADTCAKSNNGNEQVPPCCAQ